MVSVRPVSNVLRLQQRGGGRWLAVSVSRAGTRGPRSVSHGVAGCGTRQAAKGRILSFCRVLDRDSTAVFGDRDSTYALCDTDSTAVVWDIESTAALWTLELYAESVAAFESVLWSVLRWLSGPVWAAALVAGGSPCGSVYYSANPRENR